MSAHRRREDVQPRAAHCPSRAPSLSPGGGHLSHRDVWQRQERLRNQEAFPLTGPARALYLPRSLCGCALHIKR
ncbi:Tetratricopeptide Repeat Protein 39A [Manis pentadactyla]|nr:Tetratricopeptide Repeat Protein 39A [Manis pentadactyla]